MHQSTSSAHSFIPVRTNSSDASPNQSRRPPPVHGVAKSIIPVSPKSPVGASGSSLPRPPLHPISRVPVRASGDQMKSMFANATMVRTRSEEGTGGAQNKSQEHMARAQPPGALPQETPIIGPRKAAGTLSPTNFASLAPSFVIRNLDEEPHTGRTPTLPTFGQRDKSASRLPLPTHQLPSPPSSPKTAPLPSSSPSTPIPPSRLPRRTKDELNSTPSPSGKSQTVPSPDHNPRRISITNNINKSNAGEVDMTVALAPPAPITIPPNDLTNPPIEKPLQSAKSPSAFASFFRWNSSVQADPMPDRLQTPSTLSHPTTPCTPTSPSISSLERELRSVSADLAFSIRREMDLEDVITRLQEEIVRLGGEGSRGNRYCTSDYFSEQSSEQASPPLRPLDDYERKGGRRSRRSLVAVEDVRLANEKVTQLEREVLSLKHDNLELLNVKREAERKLNDHKRESKKVAELEVTINQLRDELLGKTRTIERLQKSVDQLNSDRSRVDKSKYEEEIKTLTERAGSAETQREALQLALRQLRERQALEAKKAAEKIRQLENNKEKRDRPVPQAPERPVTGIIPPALGRRSLRGKNVEAKMGQLEAQLCKALSDVESYSARNAQLSNDNAQLRDLQQRLQSRLSLIEADASASNITEVSARASLTHAHRLAVEMARITDMHVKSLEKVRNTANASLPHLKTGIPLSPILQSAYDVSRRSPKQLCLQQEVTVKKMEARIQELEKALVQSSEEMGDVVRKMQVAQIEMIELASERDEALRRERKLLNMDSVGNGESRKIGISS